MESGTVSTVHVFTVILNTNRKEDTLACLASLRETGFARHTVLVLDNDSSDGSVDAIRISFPEVEVIRLDKNLGYAGNNNVGIEAALKRGADWVFLLNEDTIVAPDCLRYLVEIGESEAAIGIVGPMVYHYDRPDLVQSAGGLLGAAWQSTHLGQNETDSGRFAEPHAVDWISGCAIMVRRAAIEQVGMIDARFFYYWEETEWCVRAAKAGWTIVHVPQAKVWHKGVRPDYRPQPHVTYYNTRNRLLLLRKHHAPLRAWIGAWSQFLRTFTSWSVRPKWRAMRNHRDAMWRGMTDFFRGRWGQMPS